ncbi:hypothetical protein FRB98_000967 [Tulasnella sp. 332]|nr:hypothetical protein FRB98_000967 [Tulasnella sp. 332]
MNPGMQYWKGVKHLMCYVQGTKDLQLTYSPDPNQSLLFITYSDANHNKHQFVTYTDADFAGNKDNKKSTSGFIIKIETGAIQPTLPTAPTAADCADLCKGRKMQGLVLGIIQESVSDSNLHLITGMDAKDAWTALKMAHNSTTGNLHYQYLQKLLVVHQKPKETLSSYLNHIQVASNHLSSSIPSAMTLSTFLNLIQAMYTLQNVDPTEENTATICLIENNTILLAYVVSKFAEEDVPWATDSIVTKGGVVKMARTRNSRRNRNNNKSNTIRSSLVVCACCSNSHKSDNCWKKHPEKKPGHLKKQDEERKAKAKPRARRRLPRQPRTATVIATMMSSWSKPKWQVVAILLSHQCKHGLTILGIQTWGPHCI